MRSTMGRVIFMSVSLPERAGAIDASHASRDGALSKAKTMPQNEINHSQRKR
jgi:hypothetical protein